MSAGPRPVPDTLYTKSGCPLCDEAKATIAAAARRHAIALEEVDIEGDLALFDLYRCEVPVVFVAREKRFFGHVAPALLDKALRQAAAEVDE